MVGRGHSVNSIDTNDNVADYICHYLEALGSKYVFGLPGGSLEPFYSALARSQCRNGLVSIVSRHESGAAFMADAYARETGKLGICCATTGPGATNMLTGVATAYQDSIPLLVITAQSAMRTFGKGAVQESTSTAVNTVAMYEQCTRYSTMVTDVEQVEYKLHAAVKAATCSIAPGPAHLSIPLDIFRKPFSHRPIVERGDDGRYGSNVVDHDALKKLIVALHEAKHPVFLIGNGAANCVSGVFELAKALNAPIVSTPQGKGVINCNHPQYYGVFGFAGHVEATEVMASPDVDLILVIGTFLDELTTSGWDEELLLNDKMIHLDNVHAHFYQSPMSGLHVLGDIGAIINCVLNNLVIDGHKNNKPLTSIRWEYECPEHLDAEQSKRQRLVGGKEESGIRSYKENYMNRNYSLVNEELCFSDAVPIKPPRLMYELSCRFPSNTRFVADIGNSFLWAIHYLQPSNRRLSGVRASTASSLRIAMGFSPMGWAIGGSIGTAIGAQGCPVVAVVGDGSMLMNGQEISVAVQHRLPVIFVVLNDAALGTVKHGQIMSGVEHIGFELPQIDFCLFARSMGIDAYKIRTPDDFENIDYESICNRQGPTLLDVYVDPDELPPLATRMKVLGWDTTHDGCE
ncbi:thiamine pyrophosphate-binding protein [Pseudomonadota bacterium]